MPENDMFITAEEVEEGLGLLAWLIREHGPSAQPLFDRLERELESIKARQASIAYWSKKFDSTLKDARSTQRYNLNEIEGVEDTCLVDQQREYTASVKRALKMG